MYRIRWTLEQQQRFAQDWLHFRTVFGLTEQQMADELGLDVRTVQRIERCKFVPRNETVVRYRGMERKYKNGAEVRRDLAWVPGETDGI